MAGLMCIIFSEIWSMKSSIKCQEGTPLFQSFSAFKVRVFQEGKRKI